VPVPEKAKEDFRTPNASRRGAFGVRKSSFAFSGTGKGTGTGKKKEAVVK